MATRETRPLKIYATLLKSASASTSARLELLDHVRLHNLRVPKIILEHGTKVLNSGTSIGDRRWDIMEQVVVAALDNGLDDVAAQYILPLRQQFPDSQRVKRLSGMALEAKGDYNGALSIYDAMLETNAANMLAMKRKVCVYKAQGKMKSAIRELTALLQTFQTDVESWKELVTLYMASGDMKKALYCQEEVVLGDPHNYQNHNRYADLLYTLGGEANVRCSRRHFAYSLELSPENNLRATYGLALSCYSLSSLMASKHSNSSGSRGKAKKTKKDDTVGDDEDELNNKLFDKSLELLRSNYADSILSKQIEKVASTMKTTYGQNEKSAKRHGGSSSSGKSGNSNKKNGVGGGSKTDAKEADVGDID